MPRPQHPRSSSVRTRGLLLTFLACAATSLLLAGPPAPLGAEEGEITSLYVRNARDLRATMRVLETEARLRDATQVIVALDAATFDPPPGLTEFTLAYPYFDDLDPWCEAIAEWARRASYPVRGTSSLAPRSIDMTERDAAVALADLVRSRWWQGERPAVLPTAAQWMPDILARTEDTVRARDASPRRLLVLVAGDAMPERTARAGSAQGYESEWRTKLLEPGTYFDPVAVDAVLTRFRCSLLVVAPEARFGDFTPIVEMPELPWVARPHLPPDDFRISVEMREGRRRGPSMRDQLDDALRDSIPDPAARRRRVEELLGRAPRTGTPGPGLAHERSGGSRYLPTTPVWFARIGDAVPFNNHAPSGYGQWAYATAAAQTGGRYVFYPFPPSTWLDRCPASYALLDALAPEAVGMTRYLAARRGDPALGVLARVSAKLFEDTPWSDDGVGHRQSHAWTTLTRTAPLRVEERAWVRRKPFDDILHGSELEIRDLGRRLLEDVLPLYDDAAEMLDEAAARMAPDRGGVHPRSHAHLLLTRFHVRMSAFHLQALGLYATELDRFIPEEMKDDVDRVFVTYVPTIRLSDCLEAYDGRELSPADEAAYPRQDLGGVPHHQGNLLQIPEADASYRARRQLTHVLRYLDPRLRARALQMIGAARDVMESYGQTGWGWTTYYTDAFTFLFHPVPVQRGHQPSRGGGKAPPPPTTPRGGGDGSGGSTPGGPGTGGGG
ncbi:MAG: hypothetical protein AB7T63_09225 [Planctomycetota bacterium]